MLVRMLIFHSSTSWKHWIGLFVTSAAYLLPYQQLAKMAQPSYSDDGELLDGGFDMKSDGVCGYLFTILAASILSANLCFISGRVVFLYLLLFRKTLLWSHV